MKLAIAVVIALPAYLAFQAPPAAHVTEAQEREWANAAAAGSSGDVAMFYKAFSARATAVLPGWKPDLVVLVPKGMTSDILAAANGPTTAFYISAMNLIRKMEPVATAEWRNGVTISISPSTINAPNIEKIVVQRDGDAIAPTSGALEPSEMTTRMGLKATFNQGVILYPMSAFDAGATVKVTLIPTTGANLITSLTPAELLRLR